MNQQTNESPQTIQENLAVAMAEKVMGWKETKDPLKNYPVWVEKKYLNNPAQVYSFGTSLVMLVDHFFDPCPACRGDGCEKCKDHKPNPRGFLMVIHKLDEKFTDLSISIAKQHCVIWVNRKPFVGNGPNHIHSFYSAVNELVNSPGGLRDEECAIK